MYTQDFIDNIRVVHEKDIKANMSRQTATLQLLVSTIYDTNEAYAVDIDKLVESRLKHQLTSMINDDVVDTLYNIRTRLMHVGPDKTHDVIKFIDEKIDLYGVD